MTFDQLEEHAANLRGLLESKRWSLRNEDASPRVRELVAVQIEALDLRVLEIERQCQTIREMRALIPGEEVTAQS